MAQTYGGFQLGEFQNDYQTSIMAVGIYIADPEFIDPDMRDFKTWRFPVVSPTEEHILTFDYTSELISAEQVTGIPSVTVECTAGDDPNPSMIIVGPLAFNALYTQVMFPVSGGLPECDYYFSVTTYTTNLFKVLGRYAILPVRA